MDIKSYDGYIFAHNTTIIIYIRSTKQMLPTGLDVLYIKANKGRRMVHFIVGWRAQ